MVSMIGDYEVHPAADLLPLMQGEEYRQFVASIRSQGQKEPIRLYEGKVLDGRNRLRACLEIGLQPRFEAWQGSDPWEHVWALNAERRHLDPGQRAALRLQFDNAIEEHRERIAEQANRARSAALRRKHERDEENEVDEDRESIATLRSTPTDPEPSTSELLARRAGVGKRTAEKALVVKERSPELHQRVVAGEVSLNKAYQQSRTARNPEWQEHEAYYTPESAVEILVQSGYLPTSVELAVEPCVGGGVFVKGLGTRVKKWITCDIRKVDAVHDGLHLTASWLDANRWDQETQRMLMQAELVITNPAFAIAREVVEMAWAVCPRAQIWIFQRRTWHDQARAEWFRDHQPDEINLGERLRFLRPDGSLVAEGTDNTIHTLYGFSPAYGDRRRGPHGGISRTLVPSKRRAA